MVASFGPDFWAVPGGVGVDWGRDVMVDVITCSNDDEDEDVITDVKIPWNEDEDEDEDEDNDENTVAEFPNIVELGEIAKVAGQIRGSCEGL